MGWVQQGKISIAVANELVKGKALNVDDKVDVQGIGTVHVIK